MQTWYVDSQLASGTLDLSSVTLLLEAAAAAEPASGWLRFIDGIAAVDYLSLVEYVPNRSEGGSAVPELVEGLAAPDVPNVTPECFGLYRQRYWRLDEATRLAQHTGSVPHEVTVLQFKPADIMVPSWRREIYDRVKLEDRLSFLYAVASGTTYALNLYRARRSGSFTTEDVQRLLNVAPLIQLSHRAALAGPSRRRDGLGERVARAERRLHRHLAELSERERAVCARIACGLTADGIASELNVTASTVATLRKRAYLKLAGRGLPGGRVQLAELVEMT